jgi:hypothetical protein
VVDHDEGRCDTPVMTTRNTIDLRFERGIVLADGAEFWETPTGPNDGTVFLRAEDYEALGRPAQILVSIATN